MDVAHTFRADEPEECVILLLKSFIITYPFLTLTSMEKYKNWFYNLEHEDLMTVYKFYKAQLQLIAYTRGNVLTFLD